MEKTTEGDRSLHSAELAFEVYLQLSFSVVQDDYVLNYVITAASLHFADWFDERWQIPC
jgi:hypothetical protein